jgi:ketosteroid isomerase-like protein
VGAHGVRASLEGERARNQPRRPSGTGAAGFEQEAYFGAEDKVVVFQRMLARGKTSGAEAGFGDYAQVWTLRDGKITHMKFYADRDEALRAAGLDR